MNTFITFACLLAVAAGVHGSGLGLGHGGYEVAAPIIYKAPILAPAVSTVNFYKAAPIPIIRKVVTPIIPAPVITAPIVKVPVPVVNYDVGLGKGLDYLNLGIGLNNLAYGGHGLGGHGLGGHGLGGHGLGGHGLGGHGLGGLGYGGLGYGGLGHGGLGHGVH